MKKSISIFITILLFAGACSLVYHGCKKKDNSTPTATCSDGIQNQSESGVDCGGPCTACASSTNALWVAQNSGTTRSLYSVYFIDANNGWAAGSGGTIIHTTNGGTTWTAQNSGVTTAILSVQFISATEGWAVGGYRSILHTTDGGITWTSTTGTTAPLYYCLVFFISPSKGWITGDYGVMLTTNDGGVTWTNQTTGFTNGDFISKVYFIDSNIGWAVGDAATQVVVIGTPNGGQNWGVSANGIYFTCPSNDVFFIDQNHGWIAGKFNWYTSDGGVSWSMMDSNAGKSVWMYGIQFVNTTLGYCVGDSGVVTKSIDGGTNWTLQNSGTTKRLNDIFIYDSTHAWIVGANGTILKINI